MNNISKRLEAIGNIALKLDSVGIIDVGCDHALLDIYMYLKNPSLKIVASDNKKGPLISAKRNLMKYGLEDNIKLVLSDGISSIDKSIDTVIISGMGTENIIKILSHENIKYINRLILSSNNKYPLLRKKIVNLGFKIVYEEIVYDDKYYVLMEFVRDISEYSDEEIEYGPYLLKNKNDIFYEYYEFLLKKFKNILKNNPSANNLRITKSIDELTLLVTKK